MLRTPTKRFGRAGITRVPFSGDVEFKFVPEASHAARVFSCEVKVVIYFKSHHSRLVLHCSHILVVPAHYLGARGGVVVKAIRYKPAVRGFDSRCHWNFSVTQSCRSHYGPGVDSACNRNEYQMYFLGIKAAGA